MKWLPMLMRLALCGLIFLGKTLGAYAVPGCPFCGPTDPPFSLRLSHSDAILQVTWFSLESNAAEGTEITTFEIVDVVRNGKKILKKGERITIPFGRDGQPGDLFLLLGKDDEETIHWELPIEITELRFGYMRQAPSPETPDRLFFFLQFLDCSDSEIASDAFAEISRAAYQDVAAMADRLPRAKLRTWLSSKDPAMQVRLGLYGMLLGLCGDESDASFLESLISTLPDPERPRFGIDGMMAGYILLQRERGLQKLLTTKFEEPSAEDDLLPLRNAIVFVWDYARERVPTEVLKAAMRGFLDRPRLAASVLMDLARWKDWTVLERLIVAYGHDPFDSELAKQDIVKFAIVCERDGRKTQPDSPPESAQQARRFLDTLDPKFLRAVERSLGGIPRPLNIPMSHPPFEPDSP